MVQHITDFSDIKIFVAKMYFEELMTKDTKYRYPKPINCKYITWISGRLYTIFGANRVREKY
jgi:hypothetical protein